MKARVEYSFFAPWFSPGEVAKITGLSPVNQRDWRRRGFLPKSKGSSAEWTKYNAWPVLTMWTLKLLADRGIPLKEGLRFSVSVGVHVLRHALAMKRAYAGDAEATFKWLPDDTLKQMSRPQVDGPEMLAHWKDYARVYALPEDPAKLSPADGLWCRQSEFLAQKILTALHLAEAVGAEPGSLYLPPRYLIWRPDDTQVGSVSLDESFQGFLAENVAGASVVIDLHAMAIEFLRRAAKPLVEVRFKLWLEDEAPVRRDQPVSSIIENADLVAHGFAHEHQGGGWA